MGTIPRSKTAHGLQQPRWHGWTKHATTAADEPANGWSHGSTAEHAPKAKPHDDAATTTAAANATTGSSVEHATGPRNANDAIADAAAADGPEPPQHVDRSKVHPADHEILACLESKQPS